MAKNILVIAEKPSVGRELAGWIERNGAFGGGRAEAKGTHIVIGSTRVSWCFGHILEQKDPEEYDARYKSWDLSLLPIIPKAFELKPKSDAKEQLRALGAMLKEADEVIHAGDPDDEGQLLVSEVLDHFRYKGPVKRLWLNALDEGSVTKAMNSLKPDAEYRGFYESALARSKADWLFGMNFTRACTKSAEANGGSGVLSIGRVQTPTLAMIVRRELEIRNFKPRDFFIPWISLQASPAFTAKWSPREDDGRLDPQGYLVDKAKASAIAHAVQNAGKATVTGFSADKKSESAPLPFALSSLQQHLSARFGIGAKETLDIAQSLYEKKVTSYPRTDCDYLPESQHADAKKILASLKGTNAEIDRAIAGANASLRSRAWNDKKTTAHHAIVPLIRSGSMPSLSSREMTVYLEILKRYVIQFWPAAEFMETKIELETAGEPFAVKGKVWTSKAWKGAFAEQAAEDEKEGEEEVSLPVVKKGDVLVITKTGLQESRTKPPKRYTEGTLLSAMKSAHQLITNEKLKKILKERTGLGTEATRATVLETLFKRKYVVKKGKELVPTPAAETLIGLLPISLTAPDMTAFWQQKMDEMRDGEGTHEPFIAEQETWIRKLIPEVPSWFAGKKVGDGKPKTVIEQSEHSCEACGSALRRIQGKFGWFFGCSNAECKAIYKDVDGKPMAKPKAETTEHTCAKCGKGKLSLRQGNYGPYFHCENQKCGENFKAIDGKPETTHACPACKKGRLALRQGSKGAFWACNRYKDGCKHTANDEDGKPADAPVKPKTSPARAAPGGKPKTYGRPGARG